jgi:hypothetical protein
MQKITINYDETLYVVCSLEKKMLKSISNLIFTKATNLIKWLSSLWNLASCEMLRFLNTIHDDLLKTFYMIYHKFHIRYHEPLTNLIFKLCLHFIQLKNIGTTCGFSWFVNKMFKILSNFMDKVLKMIQLHEYQISTNFTPLLLYTCN